MTMKTQLITLLQKRWTTPLLALQMVGCLSLSQRCGELRRDGVLVLDKWTELPNGKRVKAYRIYQGKAI
jgi:hypothetical protein